MATLRRTTASVAMMAALAGTAAATALPAQAEAKRYTVEVGSNFYGPKNLKVKVNDLVVWEWIPSFQSHDVKVKKGPVKFKSPTQTAGRFKHRFRKAGKYVLYCTKHQMSMTVRVVKRRG